jgi:hypothetical protein
MIPETQGNNDIIKQPINILDNNNQSAVFEHTLKPFFEDLGTVLEKRGYKVYFHRDDKEIYLVIMNDEREEMLIKMSMKQMDDKILANYAVKRSTSKDWEIFEKNIPIKDIPATLDFITISVLGNAIFSQLSLYDAHDQQQS